jgi:two-component system, LytTR family, sensor histidine kinase AlgZ
MDWSEAKRTTRELLSGRRLMVTFGVAGTMGLLEWLGTGNPIGMIFGLAMGALALLVAPLAWLVVLPWGLRRSAPEILARSLGVIAISTLVVWAAFTAYFVALSALVHHVRPLVSSAYPLLSNDWVSVAVSVPLFTAAGWGLSRHLQLERRLEVHDEREIALRNALDEAQMLALRSRLDPHFLFNALNLVAELCREDPVEAERCVVRLSTLLRAAIERADQPMIALGRELDLCVDYLELCRVRFGDRLAISVRRAPEAEHASVPSMSVQVLCENAVRHGIERRSQPGTVQIVTELRDQVVRVQVISPGPFLGERVGGVGLDLTRRRLGLAWGGKAKLQVKTAHDGDSTIAELLFPKGVMT